MNKQQEFQPAGLTDENLSDVIGGAGGIDPHTGAVYNRYVRGDSETCAVGQRPTGATTSRCCDCRFYLASMAIEQNGNSFAPCTALYGGTLSAR